jgi:flagellar protein FlbD
MITVSRLDGSEFLVNAELIELVEHTADTVLTLTTGAKFIVRESSTEIVERILAYRRTAYACHSQPHVREPESDAQPTG